MTAKKMAKVLGLLYRIRNRTPVPVCVLNFCLWHRICAWIFGQVFIIQDLKPSWRVTGNSGFKPHAKFTRDYTCTWTCTS